MTTFFNVAWQINTALCSSETNHNHVTRMTIARWAHCQKNSVSE